ncbi:MULTISPECIES: Sua5/YciO/YrdC/YwlC family protein [unclassified Psychrobacter]|uniref:Sua5/YciO/YrdC/YwlC family protein n=1 Tax=unclassified Psychrobacter TaxID=196806 RepID=UPI003F47B2F9
MKQSAPFTTNSVIQAADWLKEGKLLAYPTESVWGIGCDPFNQMAVQQLLAMKQRPIHKGMIVVTDDVHRIAPLLDDLNDSQRQTVLESWRMHPEAILKQAHTWLLPLSKQITVPIPSWITGEHDSVAVRIIAHPLVQQLCTQMVSPDNPYGFIVSTSCNPSGKPPALTLIQAQAYFLNDNEHSNLDRQVHYLTGDTLGYKLPSQIGDALTGKIIR